MKSRFPTDQRATWRQRFIAIARQAKPAERAPRPASPAARAAVRVRFAALSSH